jgi:hypothetical protein
MTDHKLPLLYVFYREPEIERQEGFLLAGVLAIDPIITEVVKAEFEGVTLAIILSLLRRLQARGLRLQTEGWMKGMARLGDDLAEEQFRVWSLKTRRVNVRVDDVGRVRRLGLKPPRRLGGYVVYKDETCELALTGMGNFD